MDNKHMNKNQQAVVINTLKLFHFNYFLYICSLDTYFFDNLKETR